MRTPRGLITEIDGSLLRRGQYSAYKNVTSSTGGVVPRKADVVDATTLTEAQERELFYGTAYDIAAIADGEANTTQALVPFAGGKPVIYNDAIPGSGLVDLTIAVEDDGLVTNKYFGPLTGYTLDPLIGTATDDYIAQANLNGTDTYVAGYSLVSGNGTLEDEFVGHSDLSAAVVAMDYANTFAMKDGTLSGATVIPSARRFPSALDGTYQEGLFGPFNEDLHGEGFGPMRNSFAGRGVLGTCHQTNGTEVAYGTAIGYFHSWLTDVGTINQTFIIQITSGTFVTTSAVEIEISGTVGTFSGHTSQAMGTADKMLAVLEGTPESSYAYARGQAYVYSDVNQKYYEAKQTYLGDGTASEQDWGWDFGGPVGDSLYYNAVLFDVDGTTAEIYDEYSGPYTDDGLAEPLYDFGTTDPKCLCFHKGCLLVGEGNLVRYSEPYSPRIFRTWAAVNASSTVRRIVSRDEIVEVYTDAGPKYIVGNPPYFEIRETNVKDGIVSARAVTPTEVGTFILLRDGVYLFKNGTIEPITRGYNTPFIETLTNPSTAFSSAGDGVYMLVDGGTQALAWDWHSDEFYLKTFGTTIYDLKDFGNGMFAEYGDSDIGTSMSIETGTAAVAWEAGYAAAGEGHDIPAPSSMWVDSDGEYKLTLTVDGTNISPSVRVAKPGRVRLPKARGRKWNVTASGTNASSEIEIRRIKRG